MKSCFIELAVLAILFAACSSSEESSADASKERCEAPCLPCVNALGSCTTTCAGRDLAYHEQECGAENRAFLSCITQNGLCYTDFDDVEAACFDEKNAADDCFTQ
jgi:hypothetical protein